MRTTSIEAYRKAEASGLLTKRRLQVFYTLCHLGPSTGQELVDATDIPGAWKRLSELRDQGFIYESGQRKCNVTGETAVEWSVVDDQTAWKPFPKGPKKPGKAAFRKGVSEIAETLVNQHRLSEEAVATLKWLCGQVPDS